MVAVEKRKTSVDDVSGSIDPVVPLLRFSEEITVSVALDKNSMNVLRGINADLTVPQATITLDVALVNNLCQIISGYSAFISPEQQPKSSAAGNKRNATTLNTAANAAGAGDVTSKSMMQRVLLSDPTLRTLFWLEAEENRKKKKGGPGAGMDALGAAGGGKQGDDIDFGRVAHLMRQVGIHILMLQVANVVCFVFENYIFLLSFFCLLACWLV
jgi:hypothetical protein